MGATRRETHPRKLVVTIFLSLSPSLSVVDGSDIPSRRSVICESTCCFKQKFLAMAAKFVNGTHSPAVELLCWPVGPRVLVLFIFLSRQSPENVLTRCSYPPITLKLARATLMANNEAPL